MPVPTNAVCRHCNTTPVVRRVTIPGSVPVDLGFCQCDYLRCPKGSCREILRDLPIGQNSCPNCKTVL
jgi:hypothetical protein